MFTLSRLTSKGAPVKGSNPIKQPWSLRKKIVTTLLIVVGLVVVIAVAFVIYLVATTVSVLSSGDSTRKDIQGVYQHVELPPSLVFQNRSSTGDPIDSPDEIGWEYSYAYKTASLSDTIHALESSLLNDGFVLTMSDPNADQPAVAIKDPQAIPIAEVNTDGFKADSSQLNLSLDIWFSPGLVRIDASKLH